MRLHAVQPDAQRRQRAQRLARAAVQQRRRVRARALAQARAAVQRVVVAALQQPSLAQVPQAEALSQRLS
jgi:hypothetical protein